MEGMSNMVKEVHDVLSFSVADNLEEMLTRFEANNVTLTTKNF